MKTCVVLYDKVNLLSFATIYDFLCKNGIKFETRSQREITKDEKGLNLFAQAHSESLYGFDVVFFPDGLGALNLRHDSIFLSWIRSSSEARYKISFDLGSVILGAAGFLENKSAVIRGGYKNALREYCEIKDDEISMQDGVITTLNFNQNLEEILKKIYSIT